MSSLPPVSPYVDRFDALTAAGRDAIRGLRFASFTTIRYLLDVIDWLDRPHTVEVSTSGLAIAHSVECRARPLLECPYHVAAAAEDWQDAPAPPGTYSCELVDGVFHIGDPVEQDQR